MDKSDSRLQQRFVRWQQALRESLSTHVAVIVTFAAGGLGFVASVLGDDKATFGGLSTWLILAAGLLFLLALAMALIISSIRLCDVRSTLGILRNRREKAAQGVIDELKNQNEVLGQRTWILVFAQLVVFFLAAAAFVVAVPLAYRHQLFPPAPAVPALVAPAVPAPVAPAATTP